MRISTKTSPIGVVFDCNICLRSVIAPYVSRDVLDEVRQTLSQPHLRQKFTELTQESTDNLLPQLQTHAIFIYNVPETFRYSRDPDDEIYVNLALITEAQYLVTHDKDLPDLKTCWT